MQNRRVAPCYRDSIDARLNRYAELIRAEKKQRECVRAEGETWPTSNNNSAGPAGMERRICAENLVGGINDVVGSALPDKITGLALQRQLSEVGSRDRTGQGEAEN